MATCEEYVEGNVGLEPVSIVALRELGETDDVKLRSLTEFRRWIFSETAIQNCRLDDKFFLRFLRTKKYDLEKAKDLVRKYILFHRNNPQWSLHLDILDPILTELASEGHIFVLPGRDQDGRKVVFHSVSKIDPTRHDTIDIQRLYWLSLETLLEDEETQVRGVVHVHECHGLTMAQLLMWNPAHLVTLLGTGEKSFPMRHKLILFLNLPFYAKFALEFLKHCLSPKLRNRLQGISTPDLPKYISKTVLPKEYGGNVSMEIMAKAWLNELKAKRSEVLAMREVTFAVENGGKTSPGSHPRKKSNGDSCCGASSSSRHSESFLTSWTWNLV